jgi:hypothetical protein
MIYTYKYKIIVHHGKVEVLLKYQFKNLYATDIISKLQNTLPPPSSGDCVNKRSPDEFIYGKVWGQVPSTPMTLYPDQE